MSAVQWLMYEGASTVDSTVVRMSGVKQQKFTWLFVSSFISSDFILGIDAGVLGRHKFFQLLLQWQHYNRRTTAHQRLQQLVVVVVVVV